MDELIVERQDLCLMKVRQVVRAFFEGEKNWMRLTKDLLNLREAYRFPKEKWNKYDKV